MDFGLRWKLLATKLLYEYWQSSLRNSFEFILKLSFGREFCEDFFMLRNKFLNGINKEK